MWYFLVLVVLCWCQHNAAQDNLVVVSPSTTPTTTSNVQQDVKAVKAEVYSLHVYSNVQYRYAHTLVTSRVANKANTSNEVFFSVLLPETAFISGFLMEIDGNVYKAHVKEKEEARKEYEDAVNSGQSAAHVAQTARNSNRFTVSVNIEPEKKVTFNLTYEQLLKRQLSQYDLEVNINPGQIVRDLLVEVKINESSPITTLKVPELKQSNEIIPEEKDNEIAVIDRPTNNSAIIRWAPTLEQQTQLNKDGVKGQLLVQYDVDRLHNPEQILVNEGYFVHFFAPESLPTLRKHVVFVLDVSGSMYGRKIEQLREAMQIILNDLRPTDFFSLVLFSTNVQVWDPENNIDVDMGYQPPANESLPLVRPVAVVPATPENINKSKEFASKLTNLYSTNIHGGLMTGLEIARLGKNLTSKINEENRPEPMIIFLTDGQPNVGESNPEKIVSSVSEANNDFGAVIFSLAFGDDADFSFLKRLSLRNSGFARKIYEASDAALQLKNFYSEIASPVLADVSFNYPPDQVDNDTLTKRDFNIFYRGSEIVVAGKLAANSVNGNLTARSANGSIVTIMFEPTRFPPVMWPPVVFPEPNVTVANATFMERLWAYLTIQQLLNKEAENPVREVNATSEYKDKALALALKYSFVTPLTSLVVVKPNETSSADTEKGDIAAHQFDSSGPNNRFGTIQSGFAAAPALMPAFGMGAGAGPPYQSADRIIGGLSTTVQPYRTSPYATPPYGTPTYGPFGPPTGTTFTPPAMALVTMDYILWIENNSSITEVTIPLESLGTPENKTFALGVNEENEAHQQCSQPSKEPSHCRHFRYCPLNTFTNNVNDYLPYHCVIDNTYLGVCCPDILQPKIIETTSEMLSTSNASTV